MKPLHIFSHCSLASSSSNPRLNSSDPNDAARAHIELVIGKKRGAVEQAFMRSLATPRVGHSSLLAVLEPNLPVKPSTLVVNKVTITNAEQTNLMFGPAQAAVARAVIDCVESDIIQKENVNDHYIIVSVYIDKKSRR
jgi:5,6,7,8-tetrahydromethanopterin hydro-lyase